jgi:hypothetical protein
MAEAEAAEELEMPFVAVPGMASATIKGRSAVVTNVNRFLGYHRTFFPDWPAKVDELSEPQANEQLLYQRYSHWIVYTFETARGGQPLMLGTIKQYIRTFAQIMFYKFFKHGNVDLLSQLQQAPNWVTKIVANVKRLVTQLAFEIGTEVSWQGWRWLVLDLPYWLCSLSLKCLPP